MHLQTCQDEAKYQQTKIPTPVSAKKEERVISIFSAIRSHKKPTKMGFSKQTMHIKTRLRK